MVQSRADLVRRGSLLVVAMLIGCWCGIAHADGTKSTKRPNVLIVVTDDQGWGDVAAHGNPKIQTPTLDRLSEQGAELTRFYVSPVCAPTRAALMTGRYNYRTGVTDTYAGRAMLHTDELTLAELLKKAGYRTGVFGKWHLGDNFPMRPTEQGFDDAVVHTGGGISQPADPPQGNSYFNSWVERNGKPDRLRGYCSDAFADEAIRFIDAGKGPWFAYLPFNAPHYPLEVPAAELAKYKDSGLDPMTARTYAMITNLDRNLGRVLDAIKKKGEEDNTIVVFFNDNGPQFPRWNGVLRGQKAMVYEGGIRATCYVKWPPHFPAASKVESPAAHIDLFPTLAAACGVAIPEGLHLDGVNLVPLLSGKAQSLAPRKIFVQWHRGDSPQAGRNCAVIDGSLKLVQPRGLGGEKPIKPSWELYDLAVDPGEQHDLSGQRPAEVVRLKRAYDDWFKDVSQTRGYGPPRIVVGDDRAKDVLLSFQDIRASNAKTQDKTSDGFWALRVLPRTYDVILHVDETHPGREGVLQVGEHKYPFTITAQSKQAFVENIELPTGDQDLRVWLGPIKPTKQGPEPQLHYVEILTK